MSEKPKLTVDVNTLERKGFNVQRREKNYCAIVSSENGETVLEAVVQGVAIVVQNNKKFSEAEKVHITVKQGMPVAVCDCDRENKQVLIWAKTTK